MTKEELAEYLEDLLIQAQYRYTKKISREIKKALDRIEKGEDLFLVLDTAKLSRETEMIVREAKEAAERVLATEWQNVLKNEESEELLALGITTLAMMTDPGNPRYNPQIAVMTERSYRAVEGVITTALTNPGILTKGPAMVRFEAPTEYYNRVITEAITDIRRGDTSADAVIKKAVRDLTNSGMRYVEYESGHINKVEAAVSKALLTELSHIQGDIAIENAEELGTDYFEVDWHAGARPDHQEWQGKVYSLKELETVCGYGEITGLKGVNCYHQIFPFVKGVSKRNWSDEWLKEQNKKENTPVSFGGKEYTTYEARQKQREMERAMRSQREKIKILEGLGLETKTDRAKYTAQRRNYETFSSAMGESTHYDRVYRDGLSRV